MWYYIVARDVSLARGKVCYTPRKYGKQPSFDQPDSVMATEVDPLVLRYSTLKGFPRSNEALQRLKKMASMTKPIMRNRGWKLPVLAEFFPAQPELQGIWMENSTMTLQYRLPDLRFSQGST